MYVFYSEVSFSMYKHTFICVSLNAMHLNTLSRPHMHKFILTVHKPT